MSIKLVSFELLKNIININKEVKKIHDAGL